jgi:uncharacterized membrane protein
VRFEVDSNPYAPPAVSSGTAADVPPHDAFVTFRLRFLPVWLLLLGVGGAVSLLTALLMEPYQWLVLKAAMIAAVSGSLLGTVVLLLVYPVYACDRGVRGNDFWGIFHYVDWQKINRVSTGRIGNLVHLKLHAATLRRPIWLPMYIRRQDAFWQIVREHAPSDCPLQQFRPTAVGRQNTEKAVAVSGSHF